MADDRAKAAVGRLLLGGATIPARGQLRSPDQKGNRSEDAISSHVTSRILRIRRISSPEDLEGFTLALRMGPGPVWHYHHTVEIQ